MDINTLLAIAGLGAAGTGAVLGSRAQGKANDITEQNAERMFQLAEQERARRDAMTRMFLPKIMAQMRMKGDPAAVQAATGGGGSYGGVTPTGEGGGLEQPPDLRQPGAVGSTLKGAIGGLGTGAALGSRIGAIGGPLGAGIGAGVGALYGGIKSQLHKGGKAANPWTQNTQNDFGQQVAGIIDPFNAAKSSGSLTPEMQQKAKTDFEQLLAQYTAAANQYGGRGKQQQKVIDQMWKQYQGPGYIPDWRKTLEG